MDDTATLIVIQVPEQLRAFCEGAPQIALRAQTVLEALEQLKEHCPAIHRSVCDETGAVRRHINLFLNSSLLARADALGTPLGAGDVLTIMTAVSGG